MADPDYESLTAPQKAVVDAAVEWKAAQDNFNAASGLRQQPSDGSDRNAHAQRRLLCAENALRRKLIAYNAL